MIKKFARGNELRGDEVIKELEKLGGVNKFRFKGSEKNIFIIDHTQENHIKLVKTPYLIDFILNSFEEIKLSEKNKIINEEIKQEYNLENQLLLLKKYNVKNFSIKNNNIKFGDFNHLNLEKLQKIDTDFLKGMIVNSSINLDGLKFVHKDFLKGTIIKEFLSLKGLQYVDKNFLEDTIIKGDLYLSGLEYVDKDFLKNTIIKGDLYLQGLKSVHEDFLKDCNFSGGICLYLNGEVQHKIIQNIKKSKKRNSL